ncbi:MAG: hypothetical protein J1E81_02435 [Eubacterium sp.]|nr:hypothetical protein [Eubacterium sp.]
MDFDNLSGSFEADVSQVNNNRRRNRHRLISQSKDKLKGLSAENWVDIVCCTIIAVVLIVVFCNWESVMSTLFTSFLFPIIKVLSKIIAVAAVVLCIGGVIGAKIRRRRRWHY